MRIFLSWSGDRSREVATALNNWIPLVIQCARPFISTGITKGRRWVDALNEELSRSGYGIVCITKENSSAPWLHFEAGAVSKAIDQSFVSPLLFNVDPADVRGPFQQFQFTVYTNHPVYDARSEDEIWNLMRSINDRLDHEHRLDEVLLRREFDAWWHVLVEDLSKVAKKQVNVTQTAYSWLYTNDDLVTPQRQAKSIWWITQNLFDYALSLPLETVIKDALKLGIHYTFLVPESAQTQNASDHLQRLLDDKSGTVPPDSASGTVPLERKSGSVQIVEIAAEKLDKVAATDYVIADPKGPSMSVFLSLPVPDRGFWIEVSSPGAERFSRRFDELMGEKNWVRRTRTLHPKDAQQEVGVAENGSTTTEPANPR
jgi:hypothetical protein